MVTVIHHKGKAAVALALGVWLGLSHVQANSKITADGVDFASVKSAIAKAHDGDTVIIPAGTATWTKTLTVNKNISLVGAGIDQTIFVYQTPD